MKAQFNTTEVINNPQFIAARQKAAKKLLKRKNRFIHFTDEEIGDLQIIAEQGYFTRTGYLWTIEAKGKATRAHFFMKIDKTQKR